VQADNWASEFESQKFESEIDPQKWTNEFNNRFDKDNFPSEWMNDFDTEQQEWLREFGNAYSGDYQFGDASENPYMDHPQPFEKGMELFDAGNISEAILAFEAELQKNPDNALCWQYLGQAHAENDKDSKAIAALQQALKQNPQNPQAMLALAASYTNDMYRDEALDTLKNWLENHPEYKRVSYIAPHYEDGYFFKQYHIAVTNMFIEAARMKPDEPDADVQTALGLLYNLSMEYDRAVDCFKAALHVRPDDCLLWNKLGATLANSNRSAEALGCYFNALKIKPTYVRARANLGISFMALKEYKTAAQYFLGALSLHPEAKHIWSHLQIIFMAMERPDLMTKSSEMDPNLFRDEFEF